MSHSKPPPTTIADRLSGLSPAKRELLERRLELKRAEEARRAQAVIPRAPRSGVLPLSLMQERLWFLDQLEPHSTAYVTPLAIRMKGTLDRQAFERAIAEIVRRHEALRTTFDDRAGTPFQVVHASLGPAFEHVDLSQLNPAEQERDVARRIAADPMTPFDLKRGPLMRVKLLALGPSQHVALFTFHHIISDGWSLGVFEGELEVLYAAFANGEPSPLPELQVQYVDYSIWERQVLDGSSLEKQLAYWTKHLKDAPATLELPTDRPRPTRQRHLGARTFARVDAGTLARLNELARARKATLQMVLLTAFGTLVSRLSGQRDVVVATPIANRSRPETEALVGFFMNTLAIRVDLGGEPTFDDLLARVTEASLNAYANQEIPFERVVIDLNPARDPSRNPIAQVSLNLMKVPEMRLSLRGIESEPIMSESVGSKLDLTLYIKERDSLELELVYDRDLFDPQRMERFVRRFIVILEAMADQPGARVDAVSLVLDGERSVLPDPAAPLALAPYRSIPSLFDEHVVESPERLAVADPKRRWTYHQLHARANQLAHWLTAKGVGAGDVVAIHSERSALTVWALLAVLKSGAAFTLLDAEYPGGRLAEQVRIAAPKAWISATETAPVPELRGAIAAIPHRIDLSTSSDALAGFPTSSPTVDLPPNQRAYVAFTSGTTGGPKAIAGSHAPLSHFVEWQAKTFELLPDDRFSALSGIGHDPFLRDVLTPLASGASVHVPPPDLRLEPDLLAGWLAQNQITVSHLTPSLGGVLALARGTKPLDLRVAFFAGEILRGELLQSLRDLAPKTRFVNFYGATETPQGVAYFVVDKPTAGVVPVGRGISSVQLLVLNAAGGLAALDEEGEIAVRTPYLAIGYLDGQVGGFGTSPFAGDRVYRTGDRGRYLADGSVQAFGRSDDQVKIRGFRVELREVEDALRSFVGVKQATATIRTENDALIGYVVGDVDTAELTRALRARLPPYMVPSVVVRLDSLPLTPNGKIDRRALPAPVRAVESNDTPANEIEVAVALIWREILDDLDEVNRHDNFFDVGGHSLNATRVAARLRDDFSIEVPVRTIFDRPTIAELSEYIVATVLAAASPEAIARETEGLGKRRT